MAIIARDAGMKPGYKLTEVGVIPEDWKVKSLQELGVWKGGATPSMSNASFWTDGVIFWASSSDIRANVLSSTASMITEAAIKQSSTTLLKEDAILIVTRSGILRRYLPIAKNIVPVAINQDIKALIPNSQTNADYLLQILSERGPDILSRCMKSGTTVESIEYTWLKKYQIPLPPLPEQRAIATALSDVDALIASLDKLIAKKRDIKQATMQQLLTGKTRLSGFGGEWRIGNLGEILRVRHGRSQRNVAVSDGKYPILATGGQIGRTNEYLYDKPSVLIGRKGTIDAPQYMDMPFWTIDTLFYTEISEGCYPKFVFYLFNMIDWLRYNEASGVPSLNASTIEKIEVRYPSLAEQAAIATILSDMDAEIAALEQRRDKTRALKQGMMQELFTGKTRL
jgi:type I restriction enzyme S subunit